MEKLFCSPSWNWSQSWMNSFPIAHAGWASKPLSGFLAINGAARESILAGSLFLSSFALISWPEKEAAATFLAASWFYGSFFSATCSVNLGKAVVAGFLHCLCVSVCVWMGICELAPGAVCVCVGCLWYVANGSALRVGHNQHPPKDPLTMAPPGQQMLRPFG